MLLVGSDRIGESLVEDFVVVLARSCVEIFLHEDHLEPQILSWRALDFRLPQWVHFDGICSSPRHLTHCRCPSDLGIALWQELHLLKPGEPGIIVKESGVFLRGTQESEKKPSRRRKRRKKKNFF